jgi:hypothetical protein
MTWLTLALAAQLVIPSVPPADLPKSEPPKPVVEEGPKKLEYAGKPIVLPHACTEEDIHSLGIACTRDEPCPVYLELAGHEISGNTIVLTGNLHNREITYASVLLVSDDMGKSWVEPMARIKSGVLDQVQFIDFQTGWVAGQVMQQFARDPFLLITNDGGRTWRRRALYDDARIGSIEQFWFETKANGSLIVDRSQAGEPRAKYEYYETQTGGSSWTLREVTSKPIQPKRNKPLVVNADFRVRADARLNAYRLERRQGTQWQTLASFSISLPACMPPEAKPAEPPPIEPEKPEEPPPPSPVKRTPPSLKKKPV